MLFLPAFVARGGGGGGGGGRGDDGGDDTPDIRGDMMGFGAAQVRNEAAFKTPEFLQRMLVPRSKLVNYRNGEVLLGAVVFFSFPSSSRGSLCVWFRLLAGSWGV